MAKPKPNSKKQILNKHKRLIVGLLVGILVGSVGTYLLTNTNASPIHPGVVVYGDSSGSALTSHCQVLSSGTKLCWHNTGDMIPASAVYKNSTKNPYGKFACWAVTNPPAHFPDTGLDFNTANALMQTTPVFSQVISPLPAPGVMFNLATSGTGPEWCRTQLLDSSNSVLGDLQFGMGAAGQATVY